MGMGSHFTDIKVLEMDDGETVTFVNVCAVEPYLQTWAKRKFSVTSVLPQLEKKSVWTQNHGARSERPRPLFSHPAVQGELSGILACLSILGCAGGRG